MTPAARRVTALAVFVVASGVATLVWASKNGSVGITWGNLITGCMSALIITLIVNSLMKSAGRATHGQSVGSTTSSQPPSPKPEQPTTHDKVGVTTKSPAPTQDLSGDDLWSRAINSAGSGKSNEAKAFFVSAIRKNPWKYCGVGHDSWKPSRTEHQAIWLDAMAQAGFGELARAIRNPPEPAELTISALMGADHRLEVVLEESCRRIGMSQTKAAAASAKAPRPDETEPSKPPGGQSASPRTEPKGKDPFRFRRGWIVFYQQGFDSGIQLARENFADVCKLIREEQAKKSKSGRLRYDVVLVQVQDGNPFANLIVTTNDPGPKDENHILSMLFEHNNPKMKGNVESFDYEPRITQIIDESHF